MPKITLTLGDAETARFAKAFAQSYGYQNKIIDADGEKIDNPQSKADFAKEKIMQYIKDVVRSVEADEARQAVTMPADIKIT